MAAFRFVGSLLVCATILFAQSRPSVRTSKPARAMAPLTPDQQVARWMRSMTVADKAAQLLVIPFYGDNPKPNAAMYRKFAVRVQQLRIGGMILANRSSRGIV